MIIDLNTLDFRCAKELISWCVANNIDKEQADKLLFAWYAAPTPMAKGKMFGEEIVWALDIPEKYSTYWLLRWSK